MHATFDRTSDRPLLRFERRLKHPIAKVFAALTQPDGLAAWFPMRVSYTALVAGAALQFADDHGNELTGAIHTVDPPRLFVLTWGEDVLTFELTPDGDGTRLQFTVALTPENRAARDAAGWHVCLDRLDTFLDRIEPDGPHTGVTADWEAKYHDYRDRGFPSGAPIPGRDDLS